jgi:hypothetical protein
MSALLTPRPAVAGPVGARITKAVTTSDLGISVRRSIVQGAQTMDKLDQKWESFSDKYGLGAQRSRQPGKPSGKPVRPLKPLDTTTALQVLDLCNQAFSKATRIPSSILLKQIQQVDALVRPSFVRSGVELTDQLKVAPQFNFASYVNFKAYSNLLMEKQIDYQYFRREFLANCGPSLLALFLSANDLMNPASDSSADSKISLLKYKLGLIDKLAESLRQKGFIADWDLSPLDSDRISDWSEELDDLTFSIAFDGDITLNAQILLQEQGLNLIPSFVRFMVEATLQDLPDQQVTVDEYYMDTDYNSDPDKFKVKQLLLNILLENK